MVDGVYMKSQTNVGCCGFNFVHTSSAIFDEPYSNEIIFLKSLCNDKKFEIKNLIKHYLSISSERSMYAYVAMPLTPER